MLSGDGGQLYGEYRTRYGDFFVQGGGIQPRVDDPDLKDLLAGPIPGELEGRPSWGGRLIYERDGGRVRLAVTAIQSNADFTPQLSGVGRGSWNFDPWIFSAQYNAERWSLTGEYALRRIQFENFTPSPPKSSSTGESYYVQGIYRIALRWEAMVRYDVLYWDKDDRDGIDFEAATGGLFQAHSRFAKDLTVGIRWDITPTFMLRAEYHNVDGTGWLSRLENPQGTKQHWNLFALLAAYRF